MAKLATVTERILARVSRADVCLLDTLFEAFPDRSRHEVFLELVRLSRQGKVVLKFERKVLPHADA